MQVEVDDVGGCLNGVEGGLGRGVWAKGPHSQWVGAAVAAALDSWMHAAPAPAIATHHPLL